MVTFAPTSARESIVIGNSEHPVAKLVTSLLAKPVPGHSDLWYVRTNKDNIVVTYRPRDKSLAFHEMSYLTFKEHVQANTLPLIDVVDIPDTDKWIGNAIYRELVDSY